MDDPIKFFLTTYRGAEFFHSETIFNGLEQGVLRLVELSADCPCGLYAEHYRGKADFLEGLDSCPDPALRDAFRQIGEMMGSVGCHEMCREWVFADERLSYRVFEAIESRLIAGCEIFNWKEESERLAQFMAIGIARTREGLQRVSALFRENGLHFGAEGTLTSGYEFFTETESANSAIELLLLQRNPGEDGFQLYSRPRSLNEGTRYDRLLDHLEGEDPNRPSYSGIQINA